LKKVLLALIILTLVCVIVWASTTGLTIATSGTGIGWTNPGNITADDDTYATIAGGQVNPLQGGYDDFSIPSDIASIDSIVVSIETRHDGGGSPASRAGWYGPSKDGSTFAGDSVTYEGVNKNNIVHADTGMWGTTWTYAEANAIYTISHTDVGAGGTHQIDWHKVEIFYTEAGGEVVSYRRREERRR
jgi:hypothetical protein